MSMKAFFIYFTGTFQDVANKIGYKYGEKDKELFGPPKIKQGWHSMSEKMFSTISGSEDYIFQEDFLVTSDIGLTIKSQSGEILLGRNKLFSIKITANQL